MGLIDGGQQLDVSPSIALRKALAPVRNGLDRTAFATATDQPRHLRPAQAGHLRQVPPQQSPRPTALLRVLLPTQNLFDPVINLLLGFAFEPDPLPGF